MGTVCYKNFEELPLMLSVLQTASALGISRAGAYALVKRQDFPSITIGNRILVPKEGLIQWIREQTKDKEGL